MTTHFTTIVAVAAALLAGPAAAGDKVDGLNFLTETATGKSYPFAKPGEKAGDEADIRVEAALDKFLYNGVAADKTYPQIAYKAKAFTVVIVKLDAAGEEVAGTSLSYQADISKEGWLELTTSGDRLKAAGDNTPYTGYAAGVYRVTVKVEVTVTTAPAPGKTEPTVETRAAQARQNVFVAAK